MIPLTDIWLSILAFFAAIINGGIGYGFSSTITPIAVLFVSNKILNPALVVCELGVNLTLLYVERRNIRHTWRKAVPFIVGVAPGVIIGSYALSIVDANAVKIFLYAVLLPLIFVQLLGFSWPIKKERRISPFIGGLTGILYSLTTISGPPLALFWRNQGLVKDEFRCVMSQIRVAESSFTVVTYMSLGLFSSAAINLIPFFVVPVLVGVPLGVFALRKMRPGIFRQLVMTADGIFVSFGLSKVLQTLSYISPAQSYALFAAGSAVVVIVAIITTRRLLTKEKAERRIKEIYS